MEAVRTLLVQVILLSTPLGAEQWRTVNNDVEHYRVNFPKTWVIWGVYPDGDLSGTTYIPSQVGGGGLVPPGEAVIEITPNRDEYVMTIDAWINKSLRYAEEVGRRKITLQAGPRGSVKAYVGVESRNEVAPGVYYRAVTAYYTLTGRLFAARLEFKEGDKRERSYRLILDQVVRSVVAVGRTANP